MAADEVLSLGAPGQQFIHLADGAIVDGNTKSPAFDVQGQILAHHREADQSDVAIVGHVSG